MIERRHLAIELRADVAGRKLAGYAARFGTAAEIDGFTETIRSGAFRRSLAGESDILAWGGRPLAGKAASADAERHSTVSEDARGLAFELDVPPTTLGNDVLAMVERGDGGGCSFGFRVPAGGDYWPDRRTRELRQVELVEVSVVHAFPAYEGTSVAARSTSGRHRPKVMSPAARRRLIEYL